MSETSRVGRTESAGHGWGLAHFIFHAGGEKSADVLSGREGFCRKSRDVLCDAGVGAVGDLQRDRLTSSESGCVIRFVVGQRRTSDGVDGAGSAHWIIQIGAQQIEHPGFDCLSPITDRLGGGGLRE